MSAENQKQQQQSYPCKNIVERISEMYMEIDSDASRALDHTNDEYAAVQKEMTALQKEHPIIVTFLDGKNEIHLTAEEHKAILKYHSLRVDIENMERLQIYFQGHVDGYSYLKRIGAL